MGGSRIIMTIRKVDTEVLYMDKRFKVIHVYDSGYCEIRKISNCYQVELALLADLDTIK